MPVRRRREGSDGSLVGDRRGGHARGGPRRGAAQPRRIRTACTHAGLDITDRDAVDSAVHGHDVVANLAAWTAVDAAEEHEDEATLVNGTAAAHLAEAAGRAGARMIQLSTDYVFAGTATTPYPEGAPTDPVNAYGRSKLVGEAAVLRLLPDAGYVVRTAWLYGAHGPNFVTTMARLLRRGQLSTWSTTSTGSPRGRAMWPTP